MQNYVIMDKIIKNIQNMQLKKYFKRKQNNLQRTIFIFFNKII